MNGCSLPLSPARSLRTAKRVLETVPDTGAVTEQGEHHVGSGFFGRAAARAGFYGLAEMVDAENEGAGVARQRRKPSHDAVGGRGVVLVAVLGITGRHADGVDDDQDERHGELGHHLRMRPAGDRLQDLSGLGIDQRRAAIGPGERHGVGRSMFGSQHGA